MQHDITTLYNISYTNLGQAAEFLRLAYSPNPEAWMVRLKALHGVKHLTLEIAEAYIECFGKVVAIDFSQGWTAEDILCDLGAWYTTDYNHPEDVPEESFRVFQDFNHRSRKYSYHCPDCDDWSGHMQPMGPLHVLEPSDQEKLKESPELTSVACEVLRCTCGKELSWFDLIKRQRKD